jgi:2-methylisocitrate lyase-like PEP mutase family enzyme
MHDQTEAFRALHRGQCFVIPNPWDAGSARMLAELGFKALAAARRPACWAGATAN